MRRVIPIRPLFAITAALTALLWLASAPAAPGPRAAVPPADRAPDVAVGLGLNVEATQLSVDGFIFYGADSSAVGHRHALQLMLGGRLDASETHIHTVELIRTPNAGDCVERLTAVSRVLRSVSRIAVRQWWRAYSSPFVDEGN